MEQAANNFFVQLENFLVWFLKQVYWRWPKQKYEIRYKLNLLNHTLLYFVGNEIWSDLIHNHAGIDFPRVL